MDAETNTAEEVSLTPSKSQEKINYWGRLISLNPAHPDIKLIENEYVIGRQKACPIRIDIPTISGRHCCISREFTNNENEIFFIQDLSSNGTYLDGQRLPKNTKTLLKNGSEIILIMKANNSEKIWFIFQHFSPEKQDECGPEKFYFIKDSIGSGAFAVVKLAIEKKTGEKYAIKIIDKKKFSMNNRSRKDVIMDEVNILMKVKHPNIIFIKEVFDSPNNLCIVLELSNGGELFERIVKNGRFSEDRCRNLFYQMLLAVEYLHGVGISHRDLKPENILLQSQNDDIIKISDFGLSRIIGEGSFMKTLCGTPQYLAPEILTSVQREEGYGKEVDLWSLGVILYILLCGYHPFDDTKPIPVLKQIRKGDFSFPEKDWGSISDLAKDLVRGLMTVDPAKRLSATQALNHPWMLLHPANQQRLKEPLEEVLPKLGPDREPPQSLEKGVGALVEENGKADDKEGKKRKADITEVNKKAKTK